MKYNVRLFRVIPFVLALLFALSACDKAESTIKAVFPNESSAANESAATNGDESVAAVPEDTRTTYEKRFDNGPIPAQDKDGLWGYIDSAGNYVISPQFGEAERFTSEGLALVRDRESYLYGFIDSTGAYAIEMQYKKASSFSDGLAVVEVDGLCGYINPSGSYEIEPAFFSAFNFSEGLAAVTAELAEPLYLSGYSVPATIGFGFIDESGAYVIPPAYADATSFSNGAAFVTYWSDRPANDTMNETMHPIDKNGNEISQISFKLHKYYSTSGGSRKRAIWNEGFCVVTVGDRQAIIDENFEFLLLKDGSSFDRAGEFNMGCAPVRDSASGLWGYIDTEGEWIIRPQYIDAGDFNDEGEAVVGIATGGEFTKEYLGSGSIYERKVIDKSGTVISDYPGGPMWLWYESPLPVENEPGYFNYSEAIHSSGLYSAVLNEGSSMEAGYIDFDENVVIEFKFEDAGLFSSDGSYAKVKYNGYYGIINSKGEWLVAPEFNAIS